ncbi:failed axon connections homolog, partial [Patella vulgata]|uniref:failed axon connections homolog n=1 Tax=Patella vulgata TaxID=6465 RepID=UPI002180365A
FCLKVETYLRMNKIPYQNSHGRRKSKKGKVPFIEFNGQEVNDSSLIIEFLNEKLNTDLNSHLTSGKLVKKQAEAHGIGRHSYEEMVGIEEGDLRAMSEFLGTKSFFFGHKPCETDCALFGQLSQLRWQLPNTKGEYFVNEKYTNLRDYCDRMKATFWPDWNNCITHVGKSKNQNHN